MAVSGKHALLVGVGFLAGTLGIKALKSAPAHKAYVAAVSAGLRAKNEYQKVVEEAKAQVDDIVAEATYINEQKAAETAPAAE